MDMAAFCDARASTVQPSSARSRAARSLWSEPAKVSTPQSAKHSIAQHRSMAQLCAMGMLAAISKHNTTRNYHSAVPIHSIKTQRHGSIAAIKSRREETSGEVQHERRRNAARQMVARPEKSRREKTMGEKQHERGWRGQQVHSPTSMLREESATANQWRGAARERAALHPSRTSRAVAAVCRHCQTECRPTVSGGSTSGRGPIAPARFSALLTPRKRKVSTPAQAEHLGQHADSCASPRTASQHNWAGIC